MSVFSAEITPIAQMPDQQSSQEEQKLYTTTAFCLKATDYSEADKILQLYSPDVGKISAIAKGVKKQKSKLAGACELLNLSRIQFSRGKNLDLVIQYEPLNGFSGIRKDILKLAFASLFAELVLTVATTADLESPLIFALLDASLEALDASATTSEAIVPVACRFQLGLLDILGVHPDLTQCLISQSPLDASEKFYYFAAQQGGIIHPAAAQNLPHNTAVVPVSTQTLLALNTLYADAEQAPWSAITRVKTQKFLQYLVNHTLEKGIKAYDFALQLLSD